MNIALFFCHITLTAKDQLLLSLPKKNMDGLGVPLNSKEDNAKLEKLERANKTHVAEQKTNSRTLDAFRRLVQIATAVVVALLLMAWFVDHPAMASSTKTPVLGALALICVAYIVALELAHGRTGVIMFLIISGCTSAALSGGYAMCWLHHHM
jgi:hypothetical protein